VKERCRVCPPPKYFSFDDGFILIAAGQSANCLDIALSKLNGIDAANAIRRVSPHSKILFVGVDTYPDIVRVALSSGAERIT
jgi:hypothetical protein